VAPLAGAVSATVGGVVSGRGIDTVRAALVVALPAASTARAVIIANVPLTVAGSQVAV